VATKLSDQLTTQTIRQINQARSNDVWIDQNSVIGEWGLGQKNLWDRLIQRSNEVLVTGGLSCMLWRQDNSGPPCTSVKSETGQSFARCPVCFGTGIVGGYERFGYETLNLVPNANNVILDNIVVKDKQPIQAELAPGQDIGTITFPLFQITKSYGFDSFRVAGQDGIRLLSKNALLIEYSVDGGNTYFDINHSDVLNEPSFVVRFRVTIQRLSPDMNPYFQMLQVRFQMMRDSKIYISRRWFPEQNFLESFGVRVTSPGLHWWTTSTLGNLSITEPIRLRDNDIFDFEQGSYNTVNPVDSRFSPDADIVGRFEPTNVQYIEPLGNLISQRFDARIIQKDEPIIAVF